MVRLEFLLIANISSRKRRRQTRKNTSSEWQQSTQWKSNAAGNGGEAGFVGVGETPVPFLLHAQEELIWTPMDCGKSRWTYDMRSKILEKPP